jgi:hypothetical protein
MSDWKGDKGWSDRFLTEMKSILGIYLIGEPPVEEDQERNTDLMVLRMDAVRIGCRIRRPKYLAYAQDFTIRAGRPSGAKTELTKIIEGWGDYFFYGISDQQERHLAHWILGDLRAFRIWYSRQLVANQGRPPGEWKPNRDQSSHFFAFRWADIPGFVIANSDSRQERAA